MIVFQCLGVYLYIFVAHPNVQQLLGSIWYEGLPGFKRKSIVGQCVQVAKMGAMFPIYCTIYMLAPESEYGQYMKKPFVKFICHSSSYMMFLTLLVSQYACEKLTVGMGGRRISGFQMMEFVVEALGTVIKQECATVLGVSASGIFSIGMVWNIVASRAGGVLEESRERRFARDN
ncbi:jg17131 [Pararge aegeria aegeria]|uniref:Jg17131 protein n=1 Tax=Pararge aegeria aegeria TaxID=348720 RepID=A0A8S4R190_9NEOP|nr:jg17131 [Pararge aegeria aegeria]